MSRGSIVRLVLALLALVGTQAAFLRSAFPRASRAAAMRVIDQNLDAQSQQSVDQRTVPPRSGRRGGPTVGTSAPTTPELTGAIDLRQLTAYSLAPEAPPSFVPPPLFRPPRAG